VSDNDGQPTQQSNRWRWRRQWPTQKSRNRRRIILFLHVENNNQIKWKQQSNWVYFARTRQNQQSKSIILVWDTFYNVVDCWIKQWIPVGHRYIGNIRNIGKVNCGAGSGGGRFRSLWICWILSIARGILLPWVCSWIVSRRKYYIFNGYGLVCRFVMLLWKWSWWDVVGVCSVSVVVIIIILYLISMLFLHDRSRPSFNILMI
jgi:hypothetical protein